MGPGRAQRSQDILQSNQKTGLRGIYFKIDEFFRDVFQRILAGLVYSMI